MLIFLVKQVMSVRKAILGRNEPAQLAWGVAFGILLGIVPHGNLLAVALLILLLSLRLNHGIATVAAVGATFLATRLDPYSHQVGRYVLTHEDLSRHVANAWQMPFMPWTDLNNTIVMGSFVIGAVALVPIFLLTYPIFHFFAPKHTPIDGPEAGSGAVAIEPLRTDMASPGIPDVPSAKPQATAKFAVVSDDSGLQTVAPVLQASAIDAAITGMQATSKLGAATEEHAPQAEPQLIETRIDVIRIGKRTDGKSSDEVELADVSQQDEPMSEALRYLLRQVRNANRRSAA